MKFEDKVYGAMPVIIGILIFFAIIFIVGSVWLAWKYLL